MVPAVGWTTTGPLAVVLVGFLLVPVTTVLSVVPFVHTGYAAYKVNLGVDYRYPSVADMIGGGRRNRAL